MNIFIRQSRLGMVAVAMLLMMNSCSTEELLNTTDTDATTLAVSVSDGGFASTRAIDSDYTTKFTSGDKIGVFAVAGGKVVSIVNNLCLTYDGSSWFTDAGGSMPSYPGATYYAYYPYTDGTAIDPTASTADGAFADLVTNWQPKAKQTSYADYTASDLMIARGTLSSSTVSFSMAHKMGLVVVDVPKTVYKFTNTELADYTAPTVISWSNNVSMHSMGDGIYRYIIKPETSQTFIGSYGDDNAFTFTSTGAVGTYNKYTVGNGETVELTYELALGDYLMSDGSLRKTLTDDEKAACIGVVFCIDQNRIGEAEKNALNGNAHGLVLAKTPAGHSSWASEAKGTTAVEGLTLTPTLADAYNEISGLANSNAVWSNYEDGDYPPFTFAKEYNNTVPPPSNTTGWFLPSMGQWWDIYDNVCGIAEGIKQYRTSSSNRLYYYYSNCACTNFNKALDSMGGTQISGMNYFWTSSVESDTDARLALIYSIESERVDLTGCGKTGGSDFTTFCVLAF